VSASASWRREPPLERARKWLDARAAVDAEAKRRIGKRALDWITPGDTIAIDAGTTGFALAEALPAGLVNCVVTPSLPVLQLLADRAEPHTIGLAGDLHRPSRAFAGPLAIEAAAGLRVRTFFLGAAAVDSKGAYIEADIEKPTKLKLMEIADRVVLLAADTKFSAVAPVLLCPLGRIDALVTNAAPEAKLMTALSISKTSVDVAS